MDTPTRQRIVEAALQAAARDETRIPPQHAILQELREIKAALTRKPVASQPTLLSLARQFLQERLPVMMSGFREEDHPRRKGKFVDKHLPGKPAEIPKADIDEAFRGHRKERPGDMPLPKLYAALKEKHPTLTIDQFREQIVKHHLDGNVRLSGWGGPMENIPEREHAIEQHGMEWLPMRPDKGVRQMHNKVYYYARPGKEWHGLQMSTADPDFEAKHPRGEAGKFAHGERAKSLSAKHQELRQERLKVHNEIKAEADAALAKVTASEEVIAGTHMELAWDLDDPKQAAITDFEEAVIDYDPDASLQDRWEALKLIQEQAEAALEVEQPTGDKDDDLKPEDVATNKKAFTAAIAHAKAARRALREYVQHRKEMQAIRKGEQIDMSLGFPVEMSWNESDHPRGQPGNAGEFGPGGGKSGGAGQPAATAKAAKGNGSKTNPFRCGADIQLAAKLLSEGHHVRLKQPDQVATLLDQMDRMVQAAIAMGNNAPAFDLCKVTAKGTNLFCQDTLGIPRIKMPQMRGVPVPGTYAATLKAGKKSGKVDLSVDFIKHLKGQGIATALTKVRASRLRASQNQIVGTRVVQLIKETRAGTRDLREKPIFVTRDNYVVDGHHHWAAIVGHGYAQDKDMNIPVYRLDMEIGQALAMANEFTKKAGLAPKSGGAGGSPVFVKDGRILKGHPSLTGKKIGALGAKPLRRPGIPGGTVPPPQSDRRRPVQLR